MKGQASDVKVGHSLGSDVLLSATMTLSWLLYSDVTGSSAWTIYGLSERFIGQSTSARESNRIIPFDTRIESRYSCVKGVRREKNESRFYEFCDLRCIRHTMDLTTASKSSIIVASLVHWRLDYFNLLHHSLLVTQIKRLLQIQNILVRAVTRTPKHSQVTPEIKSLHWFKGRRRFRIQNDFHYNLLHRSEPTYLRNLMNIKPTGKTCSTDHLCPLLTTTFSRLAIYVDKRVNTREYINTHFLSGVI